MMIKLLRNNILFSLDRLVGETSFVHSIGFSFYHLLFRGMALHFESRFPEIESISLRHSLRKKNTFNTFFSDIDSTFIVRNEESIPTIVHEFRKFKSVFPMFDLPEFYTTKEGEALEVLTSYYGPYLEVVWNLRKLNWIRNGHKKDLYEQRKQERAFKKSFNIVFECPPNDQQQYSLKEIRLFNRLLSYSSVSDVSLFSHFLDTASKDSLLLMGSAHDVDQFNSLMAGEDFVSFDEKLNMIKFAIEAREQLIANTSLRVEPSHTHKYSELLKWKAFLDNRNALKHFQKNG